jgi:3-oxoacyl-[acyl-carrier protein] reductase
MHLGLKEKGVLVTGASQGIGKAIAAAFAAEGSRVVLTARHQPELEQAARELRQRGGEALALAADLTRESEVQRLAQHAVERLGTVHVLVNNAGGVGGSGSAQFEELSDEDWLSAFELNVLATVRLTRALVPSMKEHHWGRIINIGSEVGLQPDRFVPHYNAAKAAVINLTKSLSKAYATDGILVNTVSPGPVKTPGAVQFIATQTKAHGETPQQAEQAFLREHHPHVELGRLATPEEVASAVVFLASEAASFINGTNLRVDGGSVASI